MKESLYIHEVFLNINFDNFYKNSKGFVTFDDDVVYLEVGVEFLLLCSLNVYFMSIGEEKICQYLYFWRHAKCNLQAP